MMCKKDKKKDKVMHIVAIAALLLVLSHHVMGLCKAMKRKKHMGAVTDKVEQFQHFFERMLDN